MGRIIKQIDVFDKFSDDLIEEIDITELEISFLRQIFTPYPDDPDLIMAYPITEEQARSLSRFIKMKFDFSKYDYFLGTFEEKEW